VSKVVKKAHRKGAESAKLKKITNLFFL